jgi:DNA repair protein RecO (recombination protein O)
MIAKTTGLLLRQDPFSRTSQTLAWLTPDQGRVATLAKGAKRPRSALLGQYDCFYTCEIVYYVSRRSTLHILKECAPLTPRPAFRQDWRACMGASYLCELLNRLAPSDSAQPALYAWSTGVLDFLAQRSASLTVMHWAETQLLTLLGVGPQLSRCLACGTRTFPADQPVTFSIARGGLLCGACRTPADPLTLPLPHDVLAILRGWEQTATPLMAYRTACTQAQANLVDKLLGGFLHYHVEHSRAREIALELIGPNPDVTTAANHSILPAGP